MENTDSDHEESSSRDEKLRDSLERRRAQNRTAQKNYRTRQKPRLQLAERMLHDFPNVNCSLLPASIGTGVYPSLKTALDPGNSHHAVPPPAPYHRHPAKLTLREDNLHPESPSSPSFDPVWLNLSYPHLPYKYKDLSSQRPTSVVPDLSLLPGLLEATFDAGTESLDMVETNPAGSLDSSIYLPVDYSPWGTGTLSNTPQESPVNETSPEVSLSSSGTPPSPAEAAAAAPPPPPSKSAPNALERCSPLLTAVLSNKLDMARLLVRSGAKLEAPSGAGLTPLHRVVDVGNLEATRALLDLGADVLTTDSSQRGLLHTAVARGYREVVEAVLEWCERRGDDSLSRCMNAQDEDGVTPLHLAVKLGREKILDLLLSYGADANIGCD